MLVNRTPSSVPHQATVLPRTDNRRIVPPTTQQILQIVDVLDSGRNRQCRIPEHCFTEVFKRIRRQGAYAHLP